MTARTDKSEYYRGLALYYKNRARLKGCAAAVHLESSFDQTFWNAALRHGAPHCRFDYIAYSRNPDGRRATGSSVCVAYLRYGCLSERFVICIDSDYRYLMREEDINIGRCVFQTYTYSLENHYCHPDNIAAAFGRLGLSRPLFNFESFLREYSRTLYPLFIYHLVSVAENDNLFTTRNFTRYMDIDIRHRDENAILSALRRRVEVKLRSIKIKYPNVNIDDKAERFRALGLLPDNAWLYFRGHNMLDQVIVKLAKLIRTRLEADTTKDWQGQSRRQYYSERKSFKHALMQGLSFGKYQEINKIIRDANIFFHTKVQHEPQS
jgi:hypothetical protein